MIHFIDSANVPTTITEKNVSRFIIPIAADEPKNSPFYQGIVNKYPDLGDKFDENIRKYPLKSGDVRKILVSSGQTIYFIVVKAVAKFSGYLVHMVTAIEQVLEMVANDTANSPEANRVLIPLPPSDAMKLTEPIYLCAVIHALHHPKVDVYAVTDGAHAPYVDRVEDALIYFKQDSWKPDWMVGLDDILLVEVIATVVRLTHSYKINKQNLVKIFHIMHKRGRFPKLEFEEGPYGPFFKLFMAKLAGLTGNGFILNTFHMSKVEPPRFSFVVGPYYHLLKHLAYTELERNRDEIYSIAKEVRDDYFASYKDNADKPPYKPGGQGGYSRPSQPSTPAIIQF